jgi:hypothetical protein
MDTIVSQARVVARIRAWPERGEWNAQTEGSDASTASGHGVVAFPWKLS